MDVPATLTVDGRTYRDVGVRFRGMSSYMMTPEGSKRSLNVTVDFAHEDQRLMGYRTLNLLNVNGDATFARPILYSEIAQKYLPAAKANYVRVVINGEDWGVYVNVEQFNTDFIQARFGTQARRALEGARQPLRPGRHGLPGRRRGEVQVHLRDQVERQRRARGGISIALFKVLNETPLDKLEAALAPVLDVDGVLKFLALENALVNTDGYWTRASDYNIYQDERGRFHVIPHDVNEAFEEENFGAGPGRGFPPGMAPPGFPPPGAGAGARRARRLPASRRCRPGWRSRRTSAAPRWNWIRSIGLDDASKPLRSRLLAVPALRAQYLGYVRDIAEKWLDWRTLEPMVRRLSGGSSPRTSRPTPRSCTASRRSSRTSPRATRACRSFVERRRAFLLKTDKLGGTRPRVRGSKGRL